MIQADVIDQLAGMILASRRIVVFTGAGVSTESGIPDFRSPGGVWDRYDPDDFTYPNFLATEESRKKYWRFSSEFYGPIKAAQPNPAHLAVAHLERLGKLDCVITQNVDGLHQRAGNSPEKVIQLHGTVFTVSCLDCGKKFDRDDIEARRAKGEEVPYCDDCGGILKPDTVSFGQAMPQQETQEAFRRAGESDLFIVLGSSLVVYPAASLPVTAKEAGAKLVIVNMTVTPYNHLADLAISARAGQVMPAVIEQVKERVSTWNLG